MLLKPVINPWITSDVAMLMVFKCDNHSELCQSRCIGKDQCALDGMSFDYLPLRICQLTRLVDDLVGDTHFANIVQEPCHPQRSDLGFSKREERSQRNSENSGVYGMCKGIFVKHFDAGQAH